MRKVYRPRPRPMLSGPAGLQARLFRWRKLFWLAVGIAVFLVGDAALWLFGTPAFATSMLRALVAGDTPTIATGASFSVPAGSFATRDRAAAFAAALDASGLPILVRRRPEDGRYQVLVGPYVATDEAEHAQRALAAWGFGEPRLVVDDTMRGAPQRAALFGVGNGNTGGVLMVAAPGMSSVVFEMHDAPREVEARRTSATTLDIDIGKPAAGSGQPAALTLPESVLLVRELSVATAGTGAAMRAHLVVPDGVQSRLRLEGRRVYVDLAWPNPPWQVGSRAARATQNARASESDSRDGADASQTRVAASDAYREQLNGVVARFQEIQPFLLSAMESPEADVLAALAHSLDGVRDSLALLTAPPELEANRQSLLSSVSTTSNALVPSFTGDRAATVRQAIALFDANK